MLIRMILIAVTILLSQLFLPWWAIAPVAFLVLYLLPVRRAIPAFLCAFLAVFLLYLIVSALLSIPNQHLLANRIALLFQLPNTSYSWAMLMLIAALPHAVLAGFAGLTAYYLRDLKDKGRPFTK